MSLQRLDQRHHLFQGIHERGDLGELGPDMLVDTHHLDVLERRGQLELVQGASRANPKLALLQAGGDVGMRLGIDVRVNP